MVKRTLLWLPIVFVVVGIFLISSAVARLGPITRGWNGELVEAVGHLVVYSVLGFFVCRYVLVAVERRPILAIGIATACCVALGMVDELHQLLVPDRSLQLIDLQLDFAGSLVGSLSYLALTRLRGSRSLSAKNAGV